LDHPYKNHSGKTHPTLRSQCVAELHPAKNYISPKLAPIALRNKKFFSKDMEIMTSSHSINEKLT
jgi:hypothetical protein